MINATRTNFTIEEFGDAVAEALLSPYFVETLQQVHAEQRRKIEFRGLEYVYTEEIETPDGYPCCELVATRDAADAEGLQLVHAISAQFTVNGDNEQIMGRELKRLIEATRRVLANGIEVMGGLVYTGDADFGPIVAARKGSSGRWIKSGSIDLMWRTVAP